MDFRILGSLEVWDGERQLELGGPKRRAVLALLLLHANEVVGADRLVDQLWGEKAPRNAAGALHTHVSRLRKELGSDMVATRAWGYVLRTDPGALDLERFEQLVRVSESLPARERAGSLREALALWRGTPLEDLAFEPALATDVARLEELRLTVLENRIDADLEAGNHAGLVGELEALIAEHPLRERLRGQLILTLYRNGRQAEALEVYRETRRVLADQLGLEPSSELRELERAILQHDPALRARPSSPAIEAELRIRPGRRRRIYIGASLALIAVLATSASYAITTHTAEPETTPTANAEHNIHVWAWKSGKPAPSSVLHFFASFGIGAPLGMNPHVRSDEVRTFPLPEGSVVWVAPAANGGFCDDYAMAKSGGCDHARAFAINPSVSTVGSRRCGAPLDSLPALLTGHVIAKPGSTLQLEFSNGSFGPVALTWVGPPIDAGFFEEEIPAGGLVTALVLRDPGGSILAKETELFRGLHNPSICPNSNAHTKS
jgi:DNA-binding SARP family transcriptional activator